MNMKKSTYILITVFGGCFGLHKFVTGKIGMGILYLFTGGLFCLGWFVDIIIALTMNPADFSYSQKTNRNMDFNLPTTFQLTGIHYECRKDTTRNRQDVIQLINDRTPISLEKYSYEGKPAYMVVVDSMNIDIGVVPAKLVYKIESYGRNKLRASILHIYSFRDGSGGKGVEIQLEAI